LKTALAAATCLLLLPILVIGAAMGGVQVAQPSANALADIPPDYLALYQEAATELGMPWELLAAVGKVESDHGRNPHCWQPNAAGAVGPMQFLPATFAEYDWASASADPSIDDPRDAIYAAAAMLVDNNVRDNPRQALYAYNHSNSYVAQVISWAALYQGQEESALAGDAVSVGAPTATAGGAVAYALAQLGTPYLWGGDDPGGFDCSGLVQAAYDAAGIQLPRTAQEQFNAGPLVPDGQQLEPGDLVFFGSDTSHVTHVGVVVSATEMVDAPHTGATVRVEDFRWPDYLGVTRPSAGD
jgi:cell wall-associated NlpC family hydrolase